MLYYVQKRYNNLYRFSFTKFNSDDIISGSDMEVPKMNNKVVKNVNGQVGDGVGFERIRRITGYLVGTLDRFNNGKRAEVEDRVKHSLH